MPAGWLDPAKSIPGILRMLRIVRLSSRNFGKFIEENINIKNYSSVIAKARITYNGMMPEVRVLEYEDADIPKIASVFSDTKLYFM